MREKQKAESREQKPEPGRAEAGESQPLVTSRGVAVALGVSVRTVERMVHDGEIRVVRLRGRLVRFSMPEVLDCLRNERRKWGKKASGNFTNFRERGKGA